MLVRIAVKGAEAAGRHSIDDSSGCGNGWTVKGYAGSRVIDIALSTASEGIYFIVKRVGVSVVNGGIRWGVGRAAPHSPLPCERRCLVGADAAIVSILDNQAIAAQYGTLARAPLRGVALCQNDRSRGRIQAEQLRNHGIRSAGNP